MFRSLPLIAVRQQQNQSAEASPFDFAGADELIDHNLVRRRAEINEEAQKHYAIVRMEQLYPFPHKQVKSVIDRYPDASEIVWCQDEPQNQGVWNYAKTRILMNMRPGMRLAYAGRPESPSPAVGYSARHAQQLKDLQDAAFTPIKGFVLTA